MNLNMRASSMGTDYPQSRDTASQMHPLCLVGDMFVCTLCQFFVEWTLDNKLATLQHCYYPINSTVLHFWSKLSI